MLRDTETLAWKAVGYSKCKHILRAQARRAWQEVGWECVEGVPLGGMPDLNPRGRDLPAGQACGTAWAKARR